MTGSADPAELAADPAAFAAAFARYVRDDARVAAFRGLPAVSGGDAHDQGTRLQRILFDDGWSRAGWPEEYGGLGGHPVCRAAMFEVMIDADIALPETYLTLEILTPILMQHAPHLAERYFAAQLAGDEMWAQAFSEPDAGSDLASLRTRMVEVEGGWKLSGQKVWATNGHHAQRAVVLARSGGPGHRGISMVVLDYDQPGVDVRPIRAADGHDHFSEIFLDDAFVEDDRVVGGPGAGWAMAMYMLQWERGNWGWQQQSRFHRYLESSLAEPGPFGAGDADLGHAYGLAAALRARAKESVHRLAREETLGAETSIDKLLLARAEVAAFDVIRQQRRPLLDLGSGTDADVWRYEWFYSRVAPIYGGSQEIQRTLVAQRVLGLPREP